MKPEGYFPSSEEPARRTPIGHEANPPILINQVQSYAGDQNADYYQPTPVASLGTTLTAIFCGRFRRIKK